MKNLLCMLKVLYVTTDAIKEPFYASNFHLFSIFCMRFQLNDWHHALNGLKTSFSLALDCMHCMSFSSAKSLKLLYRFQWLPNCHLQEHFLERFSGLETLMHVGIESPRQKPLSDSTCVCFLQLPSSVVHCSFSTPCIMQGRVFEINSCIFYKPIDWIGQPNANRSTCCVNSVI